MFGLKKTQLKFSLYFCAVLVLAGCITKPYMRHEVANRVASPAFMIERKIDAAPFEITVYERMHKRNASANVYIEGDGLNWISPSQRSLDPTPKNPMGLHLASFDKAKNVVWMARPCQYSKLISASTPCDSKYWTNARYSETVVDSMSAALDEIRRRYDIEGFNLVGYSGGGAVAAVLAAKRNDVLSLRTIAGNLDHEVHSEIHGVTGLYNSLNAIDFVDDLRDIPQHHFIGGQDEIVPPAILYSYLQALGPTNCVDYTLIQEAGHERSWVEKWPELMKKKMGCEGGLKSIGMMDDFEFTPAPIGGPDKNLPFPSKP